MAMTPTFHSRSLGRRMREYRAEMRMDQATVAHRIGVQQPHLSNLESGRAKFSARHLSALCDMLNVPASERAELEELRSRTETPGWWLHYAAILSEPVQTLIELESEARWIKTVNITVFPEQLQTRAYAEALINASAVYNRISDADRYLELRMRRQKRITDPDCRLTAVVGEGALYQEVGGPDVLRQQLRRVARMTREHDVTVHVVPFTADAHPALTEQFVIIECARETEQQAVYVDGQTRPTIHERRGEIRQYRCAFAAVQHLTLSARESLSRIEQREKELSR